MAHAVSIAKPTNPTRVDWAFGHATVRQRFGEGALASIPAVNLDPGTPPPRRRPGETNPSPRAPTGGPPSAPRRTPPHQQTFTAATTLTRNPPTSAQLTTWRTTDDRHHHDGSEDRAAADRGADHAAAARGRARPLRRLRMPPTRAAAPEVLAAARGLSVSSTSLLCTERLVVDGFSGSVSDLASASRACSAMWMKTSVGTGRAGHDGTTGVYGITVAAELAGMSVQALRLYKRKGLLEPARTEGGTRRYSDTDIARLAASAS